MKTQTELFKLNLQRFGDKDDQYVGEDKQEPVNPDTEVTEVETYTAEEVEKKLQSEADKRVTEALKTAKAKWEEEYKAKLEEEKQKAKELSELTAEEREAKLLKEKEEEITQRELKLKRKELELETVNVLADKKLPVSFVSMLIGEDAESTHANIKEFEEAWASAIEEEMKARINTGNFKRAGSTKQASLGKKLAQEASEQKLKNEWGI